AHPDVFNMLLQVMEEGHLTDSFGRKVDFKNTVIIMTTNVGAQAIQSGDVFGFGKKDEDTSYDKMKERLKHEITREFKPEFLNRVDDIIVFRHLTRDNLKHIIDIELSKVRERLTEKGLTLVLSEECKEFLIEKGSDLDYGARPLRRAIENYIEDPLSEELLRGSFEGKNVVTANVTTTGDRKHLSFDSSFDPARATPEPEAAAATPAAKS
ncbi:MAG: AAA family ATPase, partial [Planctomycetaceae bacterium]